MSLLWMSQGIFEYENGVLHEVEQMIGRILKTMRKSNKLSQEQVSKLIGYARNTIFQYETGTIEPDFKTIEKLLIYVVMKSAL